MSRRVATALWAVPGAGVALGAAFALQALGVLWAWWSAAALGATLGVLAHVAVEQVRREPWPAPWPRGRRGRGSRGAPEAVESWALARARGDLDAARASASARRVLQERLAAASGVAAREVRADERGPVLPEHLLAAAEDALGLRPEARPDDLAR